MLATLVPAPFHRDGWIFAKRRSTARACCVNRFLRLGGGVGARLNAAWQAGTSVSSSPMFLLPCSRWVLGATPLGESRLRRRRASRRHGTRVSPRHSSGRHRKVVRAIEVCSCPCCSAPSDRDRSDDRFPAAPTPAVRRGLNQGARRGIRRYHLWHSWRTPK